MARRILALDLGMHTLRAAVFERSLREGLRLDLIERPRTPEQSLGEQVRALCRDRIDNNTQIVSCLPGDVVSSRFFTLPFTRQQQIDQVVPFELENQIPFSLDAVVVDSQIIERAAGGVRVLAVAVPRQTLAEHLHVLAEAGCDPTAVRLSALQPLNVLRHGGGDADLDLGGTVAVLDIGHTRTAVAVLVDGILYGIRTLRTGLGKAGGLASFLQDLRWTLLACGPVADNGPVLLPRRFFVGGGGGYVRPLKEELERTFDCPVIPFQDLVFSALPSEYQDRQGVFASCLGLGLCELQRGPEPALNLRQGEFAYQGQREVLRHEWTRLGWLAAGVLVAAGLAVGLDLFRLQTQYAALRHEIRQVFTQTLPEVRTIVNEKLQLQDAVETLQKQHRVFNGATTASPLELLRQLTKTIPDSIPLDLDEWIFDGKSVQLRGTTNSFDAAESIKTAVAGLAVLQEVQLKEVRSVPGGTKVSFQLQGRMQE